MTRGEVNMQEIMVDYVVQTMEKAIDSATSRGGKPTTEDLIFLVRKVSCPIHTAATQSIRCWYC